MGRRTFHIETYGCQMNKLDSHLVADQLRAEGWHAVDDPADARLRLFVTCSVRAHAENRATSNVGALKHRKRRQTDMIIGILGCMAEKDRETLFARLPHVDFVCGPSHIDRVGELVAEAERRAETVCPALAETPLPISDRVAAVSPRRTELARSGAVDDHLEPFEAGRLTPVGEHPYHAYVRVMRGCDNFCAYCIVPYVRGPEVSRPPRAILDEVRRLVADHGVRHVTLLGQSIGSYAREGARGHTWQLADLVREAAQTPGLVRLDFVTTHPATLSDDLIAALAAGPPVAPYLHLPAQSGSGRVLALMNRGYTAGQYRERVAAARRAQSDLAIASDFIVGFPGETEDDFRRTLDLVREIRYSQVFAFKYSPRPGTAAARRDDDVPAEAKQDRLARLLAAHHETAEAANAGLIGRTLDCLVTGASAKPHLDDPPSVGAAPDAVQMASRSPGNRIVLFGGSPELVGRVVPITITRATAVTLFGDLAGR